ncbi:putative calcium/calmodulin-dependent protein kinase [Arabidopsis thaliana]
MNSSILQKIKNQNTNICIGGSDHRKIACETLADDSTIPPYYNNSAVSPSDFPPESYFLSNDAQLEWLSDNAFFDRKDSQKGNSGILNSNPNSNPSSQRFLLKSKASIIGLPKPQKTCFNEAKQRRHAGKNRVILKRVGSRIKTDISLLEPSSPKVSCIGRVRSRRERSRRMHRQKSSRVEPVNRVKKPGFMASFRAIFRIKGGCKDVSARETHTSTRNTHDIRSRLPAEAVEKSVFDGGEPVVPGLGGMTRFASGRRADLLGGGGC